MCMPYANTNRESNPASEHDQPLHDFPNHGPKFSEFSEPVDSSFRVFTSLDMSAIRSFPTSFCCSASGRPGDPAAIGTNEHLCTPRQHYLNVRRVGTLSPATKLTSAFSQIRTWFEKCKDGCGHATLQQQHQEGSEFTLWPVNPSTVNPDEVGSLAFFQQNTTTSISSDGPPGFNLASSSWNGPNPMGDDTTFTFDSVLGFDIPTDFTLSDKHNTDLFANYPLASSGSSALENSGDTTTDEVLDKLL